MFKAEFSVEGIGFCMCKFISPVDIELVSSKLAIGGIVYQFCTGQIIKVFLIVAIRL